jgi:hypothetical protein
MERDAGEGGNKIGTGGAEIRFQGQVADETVPSSSSSRRWEAIKSGDITAPPFLISHILYFAIWCQSFPLPPTSLYCPSSSLLAECSCGQIGHTDHHLKGWLTP